MTYDDDLGFDPFLESNKGLADMLENETGHNIPMMPSYRSPIIRQPPPGVPPPAHLSHTGLFSDGIMPSIPSMMPVVTSSSSPLPPPPPGLSSFPQFPNSPVPQHSSAGKYSCVNLDLRTPLHVHVVLVVEFVLPS